MSLVLHTSDFRKAQRIWIMLVGRMNPVRRTGEMRYLHPSFSKSIRANDRRNDVPAVLLSRINQLLKQKVASDPVCKLVK